MIIEFPIIITLMKKVLIFCLKTKVKNFVKTGLQEYDFNHLLEYVKTRKESKTIKNLQQESN